MATEQLEYRKMVVISTAHLTRATASRSENGDPALADVMFGHTHGWFCYAYPERIDEIPDDLWDCCEWANAHVEKDRADEPVYIMFDADASEMEGLPTYEWTTTDRRQNRG